MLLLNSGFGQKPWRWKPVTKKGFIITPIIFIAFFIIAILFSFYVSNIDNEISYGIQKSSTIEKGIHDIQKKQINQINFVKTTTYKCSDITCYNSSDSSSVTFIKNCVEGNLTEKFGIWDWDYKLINISRTIIFRFNMTSFNATNINMNSNSTIVEGVLHKKLLNIC